MLALGILLGIGRRRIEAHSSPGLKRLGEREGRGLKAPALFMPLSPGRDVHGDRHHVGEGAKYYRIIGRLAGHP